MARPTDYHEEHCQTVVRLGREGKSKAYMAAELGCSRQTLDNWTATHPEFLDAMTRAVALSQAWWEDAGQSGMTADKFNGSVWSRSMAARFPEDWRETSRQEQTGANGTPIQHSHAFDLKDASDEELEVIERFVRRRAADAGRDQGGAGEAEG